MAGRGGLPEGPKWIWPDPKSCTIQLNRSKKGVMYFSVRIDDEHRRWLVHPEGEAWLDERGYISGSRINKRIVNDLHRQGMIYTLKSKVEEGEAAKVRSKPGSRLTPEESRRLKQERREEQERRTAENQKRRASRPGPFVPADRIVSRLEDRMK